MSEICLEWLDLTIHVEYNVITFYMIEHITLFIEEIGRIKTPWVNRRNIIRVDYVTLFELDLLNSLLDY